MKLKKYLKQILSGAVAFSIAACVPAAGVTPALAEEADESETVTLAATLPYKDPSLSFEERAADLVSRMTLEEKVMQTGRSASAISRLGVQSYNYWSEGIHGVARQGNATSFPSSLSMSNTWNRQLMLETSDITSTEARGKNSNKNLSYWNPTINMARDPRWGRNEESYGEDPYLTSQLGGASVEGMQGNDDKYLKTIATLKHFAANNCEGERQTGTSVMNEKTLREYYLGAFEDIVESSNPASVMSSYNAITMKRNGETVIDYIASSANKYLLTDMLKRTWGFTGYVVGDCGAWENLYGRQSLKHKLFPDVSVDDVTAAMAVSTAFNAGNALDCGSRAQTSTAESIQQGWMSEDTLDRAVYELFLARMKTGEFDDASKVPYRNIKSNVIESEEHVAKAEQASEETWVLLENKDNTLPLNNSVNNIAVVGNLADEVTLGDYSADYVNYSVSPLEGISSEVKKINPDAQVNLIGSVNDSTPLCNIKSITFVLNDGKTRKIDLSTAENVRGMTKSGSTFIDVTKTGQAVVRNIDFSNIAKVQVEASSLPGMPTTSVTLSYGSTGQPACTVGIQTTANKDNYAVNEIVYTNDGGYDGINDMYISVSAFADFEIENYKDSLDAADYIIAYAGTTTADAKESNDRGSIDLPASQSHVQKICDAYPGKVIVVMSTVGQINVEPFKDKCKAMLWTSYNGQTQGTALGKVLTGVVNPSGKITTTWYKSADLEKMPIGSPREKIDGIDYNFTNYEIAQSENYPGRTYQYYNGDAVYPFGYGTSYTTFEYSNINIDKATADANDTVTVTADIQNTGSVDGAEVVQLYVTVPGADGKTLPLKQLKGFEKVSLKAGEKKTVEFKLNIADVNFFDETTQQNYVVQGEYTIKVGASSDDANALVGKVNVTGTLSDAVKRIKAVPTGITVIGAKGTDSSVAPANVISADASATLDNDKLIATDDFAKSGITVTYSSSNEKVAKVDGAGNVTAGTEEGTAMITVTAVKNSKTVTDSFPVVMKTVDRVSPEVTQQYLNNLDNMFKLYPQIAYTAENWTKMQSAYDAAKAAISAELLEANLPGILEDAQKQFNAVEQILLTEKYTVQAKKQGIVVDGVIDYSENGIGTYKAGETEITGTITKDSPAQIELEALNGTNKVSGKLLWRVEKLDGSARKPAELNPDTGVLSIYENGIFKITASDYSAQAFGTMIVYANLQIEGEGADNGGGAKLNDEKAGASGGLCVGSSSNKWIRYDGVKLDGIAEITLRVSQQNAQSKINVSLTPNDNWVFASGTAPTTGAWTNWQEVTLPVNDSVLSKLKTDQNGCTSIYVQTNGANLDYIRLKHQGGVLEVSNLDGGKMSVKTPYDGGTLIGAVYDDDGFVEKVRTAQITNGETKLEGFEAGEKATIFAWDGVGTMKPLADGKTTHVYNEPQEKQKLVIYNFSDPQFDSFFETSDGTKLDSGLGLEGYGGWGTEAKTKTSKYNGKTYTFTRGVKGGSGNIESNTKYFYMTPDADGVVTVFFDANPDRKVMVQQGSNVIEKYGTASGVITQLEAPVKANEKVYILGGGSNKQIYGVFFEAGKEYVEPSPTPEPTPTPTPEPLPDITYQQKVEFEDFTKSWADAGMTKTDVAGASGGKVVDNTRNNDIFYFGERDMSGLAAINLVAGTKETGVVTVEFFGVDLSGIDVNSASKDTVNSKLTSANSLGKTTLIASTTSWNDFKEHIIRVKSDKAGDQGLFMKCTTTGKYCGNFDYIDIMYSDETTAAAAGSDNGYFAENIDNTEIEKTVDWNGALTALARNTETGKRDVAISPMGKIWSIITPTDFAQSNTEINAEDIVINDIAAAGDQLYLACDGGLLITMTSCAKCSKLQKVSDFDIKTISQQDENLVLGGDTEELTIPIADARQNNIQAEAALEMTESGAILVDVRTAEEFAEKSYPGSVNVPLDEFESWLAAQEKNMAMIIYCSAGSRAEKAVKTALDMGFTNVYNLGSIDNLI